MPLDSIIAGDNLFAADEKLRTHRFTNVVKGWGTRKSNGKPIRVLADSRRPRFARLLALELGCALFQKGAGAFAHICRGTA